MRFSKSLTPLTVQVDGADLRSSTEVCLQRNDVRLVNGRDFALANSTYDDKSKVCRGGHASTERGGSVEHVSQVRRNESGLNDVGWCTERYNGSSLAPVA